MALIDSLKNFYRDNVEDVNKLNDADSVLEVLRAKYGDYKGANIEEYFKELNANDVKPGDGGGDLNVANVTITGDNSLFGMNTGSADEGSSNIFVNSEGAFQTYVYVNLGETATFSLYYRGESTKILPHNVVTSVSGSAVEDTDNPEYYIVTGDCSFTGYSDR